MLSVCAGRKKSSIVHGVSDEINDRPNTASDAAKAGILVEEYMADSRIDESDTVRKRFEIGSLTSYEEGQLVLCEAAYGKFSTEEAEEKLNIIHQYLSQNAEKIERHPAGKYEGVSDTKKLLFLIADISIAEVNRILNLIDRSKKNQ